MFIRTDEPYESRPDLYLLEDETESEGEDSDEEEESFSYSEPEGPKKKFVELELNASHDGSDATYQPDSSPVVLLESSDEEEAEADAHQNEDLQNEDEEDDQEAMEIEGEHPDSQPVYDGSTSGSSET